MLVDVAITPGEDNLAGEPHTFTVQVTAFDGEGGFPDGGVPGAIVDASAVPAPSVARAHDRRHVRRGNERRRPVHADRHQPHLRLDRRPARPGRRSR